MKKNEEFEFFNRPLHVGQIVSGVEILEQLTAGEYKNRNALLRFKYRVITLCCNSEIVMSHAGIYGRAFRGGEICFTCAMKKVNSIGVVRGRRYPDEIVEKARAMILAGMPYRAVSRELDISRNTLKYWFCEKTSTAIKTHTHGHQEALKMALSGKW